MKKLAKLEGLYKEFLLFKVFNLSSVMILDRNYVRHSRTAYVVQALGATLR